VRLNFVFFTDSVSEIYGQRMYSNIKFRENPSSGSRVLCGRTDGRTDMKKLIVAFRNFANAPKNEKLRCCGYNIGDNETLVALNLAVVSLLRQ
jgi:hypothetical protein